MILDNLDNFEIPEFTIIGSGPAAITLAISLEKKGRRTLIIEAGGLDYDKKSQSFYTGQVIGDNYFDLRETRLRYFGGSSGHWGGNCCPLDEIDFYNWPIKKKDLNPYLNETKKILEIKDDFKNVNLKIDNFKGVAFEKSYVRFGDKYYDFIKNSKNIFLILNTPVQLVSASDISNASPGSITVINSRKIKRIKIRKLILACGGIENSRLLLWSQHKSESAFLKNLPIGMEIFSETLLRYS